MTTKGQIKRDKRKTARLRQQAEDRKLPKGQRRGTATKPPPTLPPRPGAAWFGCCDGCGVDFVGSSAPHNVDAPDGVYREYCDLCWQGEGVIFAADE